MMRVSQKTIIHNNKSGGLDDYRWEVSYEPYEPSWNPAGSGVPAGFTISYYDETDYENTQHNNLTVPEAVEIARAILRMVGERE
jgi:type IV secretory pathway component VirB8